MAQGWRELHCCAEAGSLLAVPALRIQLGAALDRSSSLAEQDQPPQRVCEPEPHGTAALWSRGHTGWGKLSCPPRSPQSLAS